MKIAYFLVPWNDSNMRLVFIKQLSSGSSSRPFYNWRNCLEEVKNFAQSNMAEKDTNKSNFWISSPCFSHYPTQPRASLVAQLVKNLPAMRETWVWSLGWEDPLEKGRLPNSVFWPGEFHDCIVRGSQRVGQDWATFTHTHSHGQDKPPKCRNSFSSFANKTITSVQGLSYFY